ncbi:nitrogen fixation protein NifZ (plasmid) [Rossellomorea sp. AcN35-11]|nr:nitrogen fixation protein NifZ [Rossellomorea aquimaris]WJV31924.1 nitrogen fixation protein NifZ [Rossellomorea sp. AcN35-11]
MKFKYENTKQVSAKKEIKAHQDKGAVVIPKGSNGVIRSMGWSKTKNYRNCYEIQFKVEENELMVIIHEEEMDEQLNFH